MTTQNEIRKVCDVSARLITLTASETLNQHTHEGRTLLMGASGAALTFTLPTAFGGGGRYKFVVSVINTSNYIIEAGSGEYRGTVFTGGDDSTNNVEFFTVADSDSFGTCTLDGTTTGGVAIGDWLEFMDIAENVWLVTGLTTSSGTEATPFT